MSLDVSSVLPVISSLIGVSATIVNTLVVGKEAKKITINSNEKSFKELEKIFELQLQLEKERVVAETVELERSKDLISIKFETLKEENMRLHKDLRVAEENYKNYIEEIQTSSLMQKKGIVETTASMISFATGIKAVSNLIKKVSEKESEVEKVELVISTLYMNDRFKSILKGYYASLVGMIVFMVLTVLNESFTIPLLITTILFCLIMLYQWILKFRIKNGLFGTNYYEAKQLLTFIISNKDKFDGGRKVFNNEKLDEVFIHLGNACNNREVNHGV